MRTYSTCNTRDRSITHSLLKMSFDRIFDLTAGVYFNFYNTMLTWHCCAVVVVYLYTSITAGWVDRGELSNQLEALTRSSKRP